MSTHDEPVTRRIRIPRKQTRSDTRGRWHPNGCGRGSGSNGWIAVNTAFTTGGSRASMMDETSPVVGWIALGIKTEPTRRPADGHLSARVLSQIYADLDAPTSVDVDDDLKYM